MSGKRQQDLIAATLFMLTAAVIIWVAIPYGVQEPKKVKFIALSPSYYPRLVGYCLMGFGALLLIRQFVNVGRPHVDNEKTNYRPNSGLVLFLTVLLLLAWYWLLPSLGFVLTSIVALLLLQFMAGERNPIALALIAILVPSLLYLFFTKVANIPIPGGVLDPWLLRI